MYAEVFGHSLPVRQGHGPVNLSWQIAKMTKQPKYEKARDTDIQQFSARELSAWEDGPSATQGQGPAAAMKSDAKANKSITFSTSGWHTGVKIGPRQCFPAASPTPSSTTAYIKMSIA